MIFIVNVENRRRFTSDLLQMHRQRRAVFVERLGWNLPLSADAEIDAYDREDTTYLIARSDHEPQILASARLLPTVGPHLLGDVFAHTCYGSPPRGPRIWEASRFCPAPELTGRARLTLLWKIFCGVMETSLLFGIEQVVFTANAALLPLALRCGWEASVLGPTLPDGNDQVTAVGVRITSQGLHAIRHRFAIAGPVTRFVTAERSMAA